MRNKLILLTSMAALMLLSSCASRKHFVYLRDMETDTRYPVVEKYEAIIHQDDRLAITVNSKLPELALPFNQGGGVRLTADGSIASAGTSASQEKGYRVDVEGNIDFPILGKLHLEGLTVRAATELIKNRIIAGNYIKDPTVSIEFLNFKYTVLGAVGHTGTFTSDGDQVTLIDAIAKAGDLTAQAKTDRIMVIREIDGERQMFMHDIGSEEIFNSPCYYLQQHDIVYVEPKYRRKSGEDRGWQVATILISLASAICSIFWAIK